MTQPLNVMQVRAVVHQLREENAHLRARLTALQPKPRKTRKVVADIKHGTSTAYERHGCRCFDCRTTHNERVRRNRRERLASGVLSHGRRSAYDAGCRCDVCRGARRAGYSADNANARLKRVKAARSTHRYAYTQLVGPIPDGKDEYTEANTRRTSSGGRACRECDRIRASRNRGRRGQD